MRQATIVTAALLALLTLLAVPAWTVRAAAAVAAVADDAAPAVSKVDADYVKARLGKPGVLVIDVRWPEQWEQSATKIPGAIWRHSFETEQWARGLPPSEEIIVYCA